MKYTKPPLTFTEQLDLLIQRGLVVSDRKKALFHLNNISYYRFSAYFLPFKQGDQFQNNATFEEVMNLYSFDRKLRLLILEAIEPIEITLRTTLIYHLSHEYSAFGYLDSSNFSPKFNHQKWLENLEQSIRDSRESFIQHYRNKYTGSNDLPTWMAFEVLSFGNLSTLFKGLQGQDQQEISKKFKLPDKVCLSWFHTLAYIRNLCAHHSRVWNRTLTIKPLEYWKFSFGSNINRTRIYFVLCIIQYLLSNIDLSQAWKDKLIQLISDHKTINLKAMGFPDNWRSHSLWS